MSLNSELLLPTKSTALVVFSLTPIVVFLTQPPWEITLDLAEIPDTALVALSPPTPSA